MGNYRSIIVLALAGTLTSWMPQSVALAQVSGIDHYRARLGYQNQPQQRPPQRREVSQPRFRNRSAKSISDHGLSNNCGRNRKDSSISHRLGQATRCARPITSCRYAPIPIRFTLTGTSDRRGSRSLSLCQLWNRGLIGTTVIGDREKQLRHPQHQLEHLLGDVSNSKLMMSSAKNKFRSQSSKIWMFSVKTKCARSLL